VLYPGQRFYSGSDTYGVTGSNILSINHRNREVGGGSGDLAGLVEGGLGRVGVQDGGDGLTIDHRGGEVGGCGGATEGVVGTGGSGEASGEGSLGAGGRETEQSS